MDFSLVIPVRNEGENVARLIGEIQNALEPEFDFEVIFVDDGSSDDTAQQLLARAAAWPRLRVVRHRHNYGQSAAVLSGVRAARAPLIVTLDGDGQNDPADIPALIAIARADHALGEDGHALLLINGHRTNRRDRLSKQLGSRIANWVRRRALGDATPDSACGLKLFPRALYLTLPYFDHMHRFMPALAKRHGARLRSVAVHHRPRTAGRSNYGNWQRLWVGLIDLVGVIWLMRRARFPIDAAEEPAGRHKE